MSAFKVRGVSGQHHALMITAAYLLVSGVWVYVSNYLLFTEFPNVPTQTVGEIEAMSDGAVVLATAAVLYFLVHRSYARLQRSEQALMNQTEQLQSLSRKLIEIQESERRAIAKELHDEIGQALTGLKLTLEMANRSSLGTSREGIQGALGLANDLVSRVRKLSLDLRPVALDDLGLLPALLWYLERYTRQTGVQVDFRHQGLEERRFGQSIETAAYRIVQEGLTNVARHARIKSVEVRAWVDEDSLSLHIEDHGIGFDTEVLDQKASSGLTGMHERASILGGTFAIETQPKVGTRLVAELPFSI